MPISKASMYLRPMPCMKARPSAAAIAGRPAARLIAEDQLGVQVGGQRLRRAQPALGQRVVDAARRDLAADRPPRPVGAVAADADHRRLAGGQPGEQGQQHRVDGAGVAAGVLMQRPVLERDADETGRHRLARGRRRDAGAEHVGARGDRPRQDEPERRHDGDADQPARPEAPPQPRAWHGRRPGAWSHMGARRERRIGSWPHLVHIYVTPTSPGVRLTRQALRR